MYMCLCVVFLTNRLMNVCFYFAQSYVLTQMSTIPQYTIYVVCLYI